MNVSYPAQNYSLFCKHKLMGGNFAHHRGTVDHYLSGEKLSYCQVRQSVSAKACQQGFCSHNVLELLILAIDHYGKFWHFTEAKNIYHNKRYSYFMS